MNEESYAEESHSGNTFVLPIWWGCNYRRIELTRHRGPFFRLRSHLSSVIIFEKKVNLEMDKWPRNSDHQLSGCGVPARAEFIHHPFCHGQKIRFSYDCASPGSGVYHWDERQHSELSVPLWTPFGQYCLPEHRQATRKLLMKQVCCLLRVWLAKTSLSPWGGQHSKDGAQPWAVGHQCDLDQQRNAPCNRKDFI